MIDDLFFKKVLTQNPENLRVSDNFTNQLMRKIWIKKLFPWFLVVLAAVVLSATIFVVELINSGVLDSIKGVITDFDFSWDFISFIPQYFSGQLGSFIILLSALFFMIFSMRLFTKTVFPWIRRPN